MVTNTNYDYSRCSKCWPCTPHTLWPNETWIDRCTEKCQECSRLRYSHFEHTAAVPVQYPLLKRTPIFLMSPKEKIKRIQVWRTNGSGNWSLPSYQSPSVCSLMVILVALLKWAMATSSMNHIFYQISSRTVSNNSGKACSKKCQ
jgi:hypothetical protein